ncbi:hypothetical protein [Mesorhizobium sp. INR15]|uniref:helix-turn-helix domain-containing protein n=1 Tax=Mesorhizobium sp. INR15 TaxID=2654248 RepID=UPI0018967F52|nr:hypothetical protein [Mesorhizobium sp. INR15]QPC91508.1 hypothetical protein GA829_13290 [Mesorhizobium sp. INR15]
MKDIAHPEFGRRLERACDGNPDVPQLNHGRLGWFTDQLAKHNVKVSVETIRKWFAGETRPRHLAMIALARILTVDESWLTTGKSPEFTDTQRKMHNVVAGGAVNLVAGFIQMDGGHPSFPDENDSLSTASKIDLYAIIRGAHYRFHINTVLGEDGEQYFLVPHAAREGAIVLGVVPMKGFAVRIYELDWDTIEKVGTRKSHAFEVKLEGSTFKEIKSFADRL